MLYQIPTSKTQIYQVATIPATHPIPPVSQLEFRYYVPDENRYFDQVIKRYEGATVQQQFIFPPYQPLNYASWNVLKTLGSAVVPIPGATIQATSPVPPVSQPEYAYYVPSVNRYIDEIVKRYEGATVLQTIPVPPVSQPEYRYYVPEVNRYVDEIVKRYEGATTQATFIFPVAQPELRYYVRNTFSDVILSIPQAAVAVTQTDVFTISQPVLAYYYARSQQNTGAGGDYNVNIVPPPPIITTSPWRTMMGVGV